MRRLVLAAALLLAGPLAAQEADTPLRGSDLGESTAAGPVEPAVEGTTSTLEDILRRQEALSVADSDRRAQTGDPANAQPPSEPLGTLGGASDTDQWRALRFDTADVTTQDRGLAATTLIQDRGMWWTEFREGPLLFWGLVAMGAMTALLALFYLLRGRIPVEGRLSGRTFTRFVGIERFGHWLLAGSFILLGITGLVSLAGRKWLIPAFGHESFATIAAGSKWIHNNVSWAFMLSLVLIFVIWVWHNLPDRTDLKWIAKGGGIFSNAHPPAKKFNFGQKVIFWSVIVLGASISASGLSLLFPFQMPMFAFTFEKINALGLPGLVGAQPLATDLAPHEEMQFAQLWHSIVSFALMTIVVAHIYIGSVGMQGAFHAMGSGEVSEEWAKQHHSIWAEEKRAERRKARRPRRASAMPAE